MGKSAKELQEITEKITKWISLKVEEANTRGVVVGLSGGIDSSVTAVLCNKAVHTIGISMPCGSISQDGSDTVKISKKYDITTYPVNLTETYENLRTTIPVRLTEDPTCIKIADANLKARLRMATLYHFANCENLLVAGTSNKTEIELGYYSKFGDGGVDIEVIGDLYKTEVRELAAHLEIPQSIIDKPPSAGLWEGQTDEDEIGMTYDDIDRIFMMRDRTEHKRVMPEVCRCR